VSVERDHDEVNELVRLVRRWIELGYPEKGPTPADADHSALLRRLFSGREALEQAPPRSFSCPWYELLEEGESQGRVEVWFNDTLVDGEDGVIINQAPWLLLEGDEREALVQWPGSGLVCRLRQVTDERGYALSVVAPAE
jgi:hypothetical protein